MARLKKYTVISLSVGGLGRKIFAAGDEVNEANFLPGMAEKLADSGFLKRTNETVEGELSESSDENIPSIVEVVEPKEEKPKKPAKEKK